MAVYPAFYKPLATGDLVRVGCDADGGYVLPARVLQNSRSLLSFGLSDEWTFEAEFCSKGPSGLAVFDPSVTPAFWAKRIVANLIKGLFLLDPRRLRRAFRFIDYFRFFSSNEKGHYRKPVGTGVGGLSLANAIDTANLPEPAFLKIDIEGWEYRILDEIVEHHDRFTGMAIEFHDRDLHDKRIAKFIASVSENWLLVHFHPNTHTQVLPEGEAIAVELTFMSKALLEDSEALSRLDLPLDGLDFPNLYGDKHSPIAFDEP